VAEEDTKNFHEPGVEQKRTPWVAPDMTLLPVDETATENQTGNDGNGITTHS
jgi:hypothetical protein